MGNKVVLWVVAKVLSEDGKLWELKAICDSRETAVAACTVRTDCIWPMNLNEIAPDEAVVHPEAEYPLA